MIYGTNVNIKIKEIFGHKKSNGLTGLDIGCGAGANTKFLRKKGATVTTIDIEPSVAPDLIIDILEFNFQEKYDIILCLNVLQYLTINEIKIVIPKILNSINKNGYIIIEMFNSPVVNWINDQLGKFKILYYHHWVQIDKKPHKHTHAMVMWVLKK